MVLPWKFDGWILGHESKPYAELRLFCFPYAGGGASMFSSWSEQLPAEVDIVPVQLPGRENHWKLDPIREMQPLVLTLVRVLEPYLDVPFALFGHSMGGLISFELARELRRQNQASPVHLFVSATRAPHLPNPDPPISDLPESELIAELTRRYGAGGQIAQDPELMKLIVPLLRADMALCETYICAGEAPLDCSISVFGGVGDPKASREELAAWSDHTEGSFNLRMFPGEHFFLQSSQISFLRVLARQLHQVVRRVRRTECEHSSVEGRTHD